MQTNSQSSPKNSSGEKIKLAVLGGGMGSLAALYHLLRDPRNRERFEVTLYQTGWRLGGKGASGVNRERHDRIEEHGLHVFLGFYHEALELMRNCYADLSDPTLGGGPGRLREPGAPLARFSEAFQPQNEIVLFERRAASKWEPWKISFPQNKRAARRPRILDQARLLREWIRTRWTEVAAEVYSPLRGETEDHLSSALNALVQCMDELNLDPARGQQDFTSEGAELNRLRELEHEVAAGVAARERGRFAGSVGASVRRILVLILLACVNLRGIVRDVLPGGSFDAIDAYDYIEWLKHHGAPTMVLRAPLAHALYELAFTRPFHKGRPGSGFAAGVVLKNTLRMLFDYQGSIIWRMQAGMGDTVFAPLYLVLRRLGVRFRFFHHADQLNLDQNDTMIESIRLRRQARVRHDRPYEPLMDVRGLPCWPHEPDYAQLKNGDTLKTRAADLESGAPLPGEETILLRRGVDFDRVLLGIPVAALARRDNEEQSWSGLCAELARANSRWRGMLLHANTTATQAFQIWLRKDLIELGWPRGDDPARRPVVGGHAKPFRTYVDMTQLLAREGWPARQRPGSLAYFCGPLDDPAPGEQAREVRATGSDWLRQNGGRLWPGLRSATGRFNLQELFYIKEDKNNDMPGIADQYWRANTNPSDRYVLTPPGSPRFRLRPDESGFENLFLTGDWVHTAINAGCIEACVQAGRAAARAIAGQKTKTKPK